MPLVSVPTQPLRVLVADPAWRYRDQGPDKSFGVIATYKTTQTLEEMCAQELPPLDERGCVLYLWRTASFVEDAYKVVRAWGFEPKTEGTWEKREPCASCKATGRVLHKEGYKTLEICRACCGHGDRKACGRGHYERGACESYIIATRGKPQRNDTVQARSIVNHFRARMPCHAGSFRVRHSAKPDEFYLRVQALWPGPYGELHARKRRPGWWQDGDELEDE